MHLAGATFRTHCSYEPFPVTRLVLGQIRMPRASLLGSLVAAVAMLAGCRSSASPSATQTTLVIAQGGDPGALNPAVTTSGNTHPVTTDFQRPRWPRCRAQPAGARGAVANRRRRPDIPVHAPRWRGGTTERPSPQPTKFTFENALLKSLSHRAALEGLLLGIDTPDRRTAVFRLKRPYSPLLQRLDVVEASIIPRHQYEGQDLERRADAAPDRDWAISLRELRSRKQPRARAKPGLFSERSAGVDRLVFRIFPNPAMSVAALEKEKWTTSAVFQELTRIDCARRPALPWAGTGGSGGSMCQDVLIPNNTQTVQRSAGATRAFAHAIDRPFIVDHLFQPGHSRDRSDHPSPVVGLHARDQAMHQRHVAARRLLDEAGFKAGRDGEFAIISPTPRNQQRLAQALRQQLGEVGITLNLQTLDFNAAVEQVFVKKTFDLGFASFCNGADPDIGVRRVYVLLEHRSISVLQWCWLPQRADRRAVRPRVRAGRSRGQTTTLRRIQRILAETCRSSG